AEAGIVLDEDETLLVDATFDQGRGDGASTGAELDHRCIGVDVDVMSHGPGQQLARRHHCAHVEGLFDPRSEKAHLVIETRLLQRTRGRWQCHVWTGRDRVTAACQKMVIKTYRPK